MDFLFHSCILRAKCCAKWMCYDVKMIFFIIDYLALLASECNAIFTAFDIIFFVKSELITLFKLFKPSMTTVDNSIPLILYPFNPLKLNSVHSMKIVFFLEQVLLQAYACSLHLSILLIKTINVILFIIVSIQ